MLSDGVAPRILMLSVYQQAQRWLNAGCFEELAHDLRAVLRLASGRTEEPSAAVLDSRTLRQIAIADPVLAVPTYAQQDDLNREATALKQRRGSGSLMNRSSLYGRG